MEEFADITSDLAAWASPPSHLKLGDGEVHVWRCSVRDCRSGLQRLSKLLSGDERERARRFRRDEDRERYVISHGALRDILGRYLRVDPWDLLFSAGEHGKPRLAAPHHGRGVAFNLSHARDLALVAVTRSREIGVDVEYVRDLRNPGQLVERFFAEEEKRFLASRPPGELQNAFFRCWTRKEAYVKGLGRGISYPLSSFSVVDAEGRAAATVRDSNASPGSPAWSLFSLRLGPEYVGAVAVERFTGVPTLFRYAPGTAVRGGVS